MNLHCCLKCLNYRLPVENLAWKVSKFDLSTRRRCFERIVCVVTCLCCTLAFTSRLGKSDTVHKRDNGSTMATPTCFTVTLLQYQDSLHAEGLQQWFMWIISVEVRDGSSDRNEAGGRTTVQQLHHSSTQSLSIQNSIDQYRNNASMGTDGREDQDREHVGDRGQLGEGRFAAGTQTRFQSLVSTVQCDIHRAS